MNADHSLAQPGRKPEPAALARVRLAADDRDAAVRSKLPALVGENTRVLAVGDPGPGLVEALRDRGCDVIVSPPDPPPGPGGEDDRFDVVVLVNALEHARDPLAALRAARGHLRPGGYAVVQVPNVGHGSVRLALLAGRSPFAAGPAAPVRFFTHDSLADLLEQAGFAVGAVERDEADVAAPDGPADPAVLDALDRDPDARTAQFVVAAYPVPWPGMGWVQRRLRSAVERAAAADREAAALRDDLDGVNGHVRLLVEQQDAALRREAGLRASLTEAHDALRARDAELRHLHQAAHDANVRAAAAEDRAAGLTAADAERAGHADAAAALLRATEADLAHLRHEAHLIVTDRDAYRARLEALRRTLLGRLYRRARRLGG